jgi:hypothetical protein
MSRWTRDRIDACTARSCCLASGLPAPSLGPGVSLAFADCLWEPTTAVTARPPSCSQPTPPCTAGLGTPPQLIYIFRRQARCRPRWAQRCSFAMDANCLWEPAVAIATPLPSSSQTTRRAQLASAACSACSRHFASGPPAPSPGPVCRSNGRRLTLGACHSRRGSAARIQLARCAVHSWTRGSWRQQPTAFQSLRQPSRLRRPHPGGAQPGPWQAYSGAHRPSCQSHGFSQVDI